MRQFFPLLSVPLCLLATSCMQQPMQQVERDGNKAERAADDTGRNVRDRDDETKTPFDQSSNDTDVQITQDVRRSITGDSSLSINAHNVKVITNDGVVTLRGPVNNEDERSTIERKARDVKNVARIDNQLEVSRH
jgi:hyperosmotically inducible protein